MDKILATKRVEVDRLLNDPGQLAADRRHAETMPPTRGFRRALKSPALIAEVKKASPSKGVIREDFDPVAVARAYEAGGAACLSVLTDKTYFQGSLSYLSAINAAVKLPLLRKDFILDPVQIVEARANSADAILLIAAAISDPKQLNLLRTMAQEWQMDALVEVHDAQELQIALDSGAILIGINNRNLHTFEVRLETTLELLPRIPKNITVVAESGIFTTEDARRLYDAGASALLVGESLMRADDIAQATRKLLQEARAGE